MVKKLPDFKLIKQIKIYNVMTWVSMIFMFIYMIIDIINPTERSVVLVVAFLILCCFFMLQTNIICSILETRGVEY